MLLNSLEFVLILAIAFLFLVNWNTVFYYVIAAFYVIFEQIDIRLYLVTITFILVALLYFGLSFIFNRQQIHRLSVVDFMPEDEYERKKIEWTNSALQELQNNPKYKILKEKLEEENDRKKRLGILSPVSEKDDDLE